MPAVFIRPDDLPRHTLPRATPKRTPMKRTSGISAQTGNNSRTRETTTGTGITTNGKLQQRKSTYEGKRVRTLTRQPQSDDGLPDEQTTPRASLFDVRTGSEDVTRTATTDSQSTSMTNSVVMDGDTTPNASNDPASLLTNSTFTVHPNPNPDLTYSVPPDISGPSTAGNQTTSSQTRTTTLERQPPKAKRVRFYRNGDQYYEGRIYALSDRMKSMQPLVEDLNKIMSDAIALPHGIRHIFTLDGTSRITQIDQFEDGESYVCSSSDAFKQLNYRMAREPLWSLAMTGANRTRFGQPENVPTPLNVAPAPSNEPRSFVHPRIITVIRNGNKPRRVVRHLLNNKTARSFEQVLTDLTSIVKLDSGAIRKLFALSGKQATTLRDLFEDDHIFIAYGNEKSLADDFLVVSEEHKRLYTRPGNQRHLLGDPNRTLPARNESLREDRSGSVVPDELARRLPPELEGRFEIKRLLGDGNTALVYEVLDKQEMERRALKIIAKENVIGKQELIDSELSILSRVTHAYIVKMYDYWVVEGSYFMPLELITGGDLFEYLYKVRKLTERQSARLVRCLADALGYLHDNGIVHRDVKPENLLLFPISGTELGLKLADFGLACDMPGDGSQLVTICGTPTYVAPEVLLETGYDEKVDMWSVGVILYICLCSYPPFQTLDGDQTKLFKQILKARFDFPSPCWDNASAAVRALILGLIDKNRETRLTAHQVLENPWVQNLGEVTAQYEMLAELAIESRIGSCDRNRRMEETEGEYLYYSRRTSMDELSEAGGIAGQSQSPMADNDTEFTFKRSYS